MTDEPHSSQAQRYEIRVRGHLGEMLLRAFPALSAETHSEEYTVLSGPVPDQAALHGVLGQIEALGLDLVEVRRLPGSAATSTATCSQAWWCSQCSPPRRLRRSLSLAALGAGRWSLGASG